ncbi:alpha/beta hydrolase [Synechococcus sp. CBW1002]|uniref:alpha/beta hydrolase n=1 Tax=Synechococcus sp. CBW1002 TaxID=1353134 RepID=UPI0018CFD11D|nr:alpha/beta hydrolase [Synechococcus sp. CBW1002]
MAPFSLWYQLAADDPLMHQCNITVDKRTDGPGMSVIDSDDPAAPLYHLLAAMRTPVALRDLMIQPVRTGYVGQDHSIDPTLLPPAAGELYPKIEVGEIFLPSPDGSIRCQTYKSAATHGRQAMLLYIHGGGFTVGQSEDTAYITSRIASENGLVVLSVNYRLAPEWPFPSGLNDCLEVLKWMRTHGEEIGGDPNRIAVVGDSAGGNFAAALPLAARNRGVEPPEAALLLCPITDFFFEQYPSFQKLAPRGIVYDTAFMGYIRGAYAVSYENWSHPEVSPIRGDLSAFPPTLVLSGTADPLVDDNCAFVAKLREAGNPNVEHLVCEDMPHGFYFFHGMFVDSEVAYAAISRFFKQYLLEA